MAEKLFNLPVTSYPELDEVSKELEVQKKIYAVYSAHLDTIKQLGESLFAELTSESSSRSPTTSKAE